MELGSAGDARIDMGGNGARGQDEKENEDDSETASLLPATVVTPETGSEGPIQRDRCTKRDMEACRPLKRRASTA